MHVWEHIFLCIFTSFFFLELTGVGMLLRRFPPPPLSYARSKMLRYTRRNVLLKREQGRFTRRTWTRPEPDPGGVGLTGFSLRLRHNEPSEGESHACCSGSRTTVLILYLSQFVPSPWPTEPVPNTDTLHGGKETQEESVVSSSLMKTRSGSAR